MAKSKSTAAPVKVRQDLYLYNEATAFAITSPSLASKELEPGGKQWAAAVNEGKLIPIELYQDDSFYVRVVLNDQLTKQEQEEWLGHMSYPLVIDKGQLVIAAGIEYLMEKQDEDNEWIEDYIRRVDVPSGNYRADIYTYINSVNGDPLLQRSQGNETEPIGKYFRRTRKKMKFPSWLRQWCLSYPDKDPGHEGEWTGGEQETEEEKPFIGILIQLTADGGASTKAACAVPALSDEGFFNWSSGEARKPQLCPLGIEALNVIGLPDPKQQVIAPVVGVNVHAVAGDKPLTKLDQPVTLPVFDLLSAYLIAWYCTDSSYPEIRLSSTCAGKVVEALKALEHIECQAESKTSILIRLPEGGARWANISSLREVSKRIAALNLNDGRLELLNACPDGRPQGMIVLSGPIDDNRWHIESTFPKLTFAALSLMLTLARESEGGTRITFDDETLASRAATFFKVEWGILFRESVPQIQDNAIVLPKKDECQLHLLSQAYFRLRFAKDVSTNPIAQDVLEKAKRAEEKELLSRSVIFQAGSRTFTAASINTLSEESRQLCAQVDQQMQKLGAKLIGDLSCSGFPGFVFRYYGLPDGFSRLVWFSNDSSFATRATQMVCEFNDGSVLFSSKGTSKPDEPKKQIFRLAANVATLEQMYQEHLQRCHELSSAHNGCRTFDPTIDECAKRFEEGLQKQA